MSSVFYLLLSQPAVGQDKQIIDQVVAKIGSEFILLSDVESQFALLESEQGELPEEARCLILDNLLTQNLLLNQAKIDSVVVSDEEVAQQLDARIDRILQLMGGDPTQFEQYYGRTVEEVRVQMQEDLRNQLLVERMRNQLIQGGTVTPSEVKTFFDRIPADSLPYFSSEVELGEIIMYPEVNEEERQKALDQITEIRTQILEEGEDFAKMAKKFSDDKGSARIGGDLGWAKRGDYVQEFEATAYNLEVGEYSEVFESEYGFHFMQLLERRGNRIHVRHILIKPEITAADLEKTRQKLDTIRLEVLNDSISFSRAVKRYSNKDAQSYNNDGRMVNPQTGNTFFETADLDPAVYFAIEDIEVGDITEPIEYASPRGERGYRIIRLQSRTDPHVASLTQDYSKIRNAALEEKRSKIINEWVKDKIRSTYVSVSARFRDCDILQKWFPDNTRP